MNQLSTSKRKAVISALVEGVSINSTVRMNSVSKPTILKLIRDVGSGCEAYHDEHVRGVKPEHVQTDEIWSFDYCKAKNVATAWNAPPEAGDCWTWTAIDSDSKLVVAYRVGPRTKEDANEFMLDLAGRIVMRRYTRLTNAHSKKLENHACAVAMFFMFYNFCRAHSTIGTSPAVAAGITDHVWTIEELIGLLP